MSNNFARKAARRRQKQRSVDLRDVVFYHYQTIAQLYTLYALEEGTLLFVDPDQLLGTVEAFLKTNVPEHIQDFSVAIMAEDGEIEHESLIQEAIGSGVEIACNNIAELYTVPSRLILMYLSSLILGGAIASGEVKAIESYLPLKLPPAVKKAVEQIAKEEDIPVEQAEKSYLEISMNVVLARLQLLGVPVILDQSFFGGEENSGE
jgi:hypothetical protein